MQWHGESSTLKLHGCSVSNPELDGVVNAADGPSYTELLLLGRWTGMCHANMPIRRELSHNLISSQASDPMKGHLRARLRAGILLRHSVQPPRPRLFLAWLF